MANSRSWHAKRPKRACRRTRSRSPSGAGAPITTACKRTVRKWTLVTLLGLGVIIAYVDRTNLAIALASPSFKEFFALSDTGRGVLNSVFFWTYTVLQIPAGLVVDRFGVKRPLAISFVLWCLVAAATSIAGAFWQLVALRLML